jgi:hypothetical protein
VEGVVTAIHVEEPEHTTPSGRRPMRPLPGLNLYADQVDEIWARADKARHTFARTVRDLLDQALAQ